MNILIPDAEREQVVRLINDLTSKGFEVHVRWDRANGIVVDIDASPQRGWRGYSLTKVEGETTVDEIEETVPPLYGGIDPSQRIGIAAFSAAQFKGIKADLAKIKQVLNIV